MKNLLIIIISVLTFVVSTYAQTESQFKASSGITTEVGFTPFASEYPVVYTNTLNARWFYTPQYALRLGLSADYNSRHSENTSQSIHEINDYNSYSIGFHPGIEKHFEGTDRLSPYLGAEIFIRRNFSDYKREFDTITQIMQVGEEIIFGKTDYSKSSVTSTGVGLLAGTDFYISKNIYLGVEFSYNFQYYFPSTTLREIDGKELDLYSEYSGFSLRASTQGMLRLGWKF